MFTMILRLPEDLEAQCRKTLNRLRKMHEQEIKEFEKKLPKIPVTQINVMRAKRDELAEQGKRITMHNLVRVAVEEALSLKLDDQTVLAKMADEGIAVGRPRRGANGQ